MDSVVTGRLGFRSILFVTLALMLFVAGAIAAVILIRATGAEVEIQLREQYQARTDQVAQHLASAPPVDWSAIIERASSAKDEQLTIFGAGLRMRAGHQAAELARDVVVLQVRNGQRWASRAVEDERGAGHLIARRIEPKDGSVAILVARYSLEKARESMESRHQAVLVYLLIDILLVLILGLYLSGRLLVGPLERFSEAAEKMDVKAVEPGEFAVVNGPAEVQRLAVAFADLVARLQARNDEIATNLVELETTRDSLVRSEKLATVGRLAAGVAHEIGNPLASVVGFLDYLKRDDEISDALRADLIDRMVREVGRMSTTLRQLLDFSRTGAAEPVLVRLEDVVNSTIKLVGYHRKMTKIRVEVEGETAPVHVDPQRMNQVFANLFLNAADAIDGEGDITIEFARDAGRSVVRIRDSGPGIPEAELPHVFEPFWSTKPSGAGTGLGLSLSQRIVEEVGGELIAGNHPDGGALFVLSFPAAIAS
jgi:two-component system, NtrC family, sensor kinase